MNETIQADFIVEHEESDRQAPVHLTGWEGVVFELEDEAEWPWS